MIIIKTFLPKTKLCIKKIEKNLKLIIEKHHSTDKFPKEKLNEYFEEIFGLININKLSIKDCLEKGSEMSSKVIQQIGARL